MHPIEVKAGSISTVDNRLWHTSGANITQNEERGLLFKYYTPPFIRPAWKFSAVMLAKTKSSLPDQLKHRLGFE